MKTVIETELARVKTMTIVDVVNEMAADTPLARARRAFYHWMAKIEQKEAQLSPPSVAERRRLEFQAALEIVAAYNHTSIKEKVRG